MVNTTDLATAKGISLKSKVFKPETLVKLGKPFFNKLGTLICDMIRDETINKHQDVWGHRFPPYSEKYAAKKGSGGFKGKRQSSKSTTPDLVLSFDMMQDLQTRKVSSKWVRLGWSAIESAKVAGNALRKRIITDRQKPASTNVVAMSMNRINRQIKLNIKQNQFHIKLNMGK